MKVVGLLISFYSILALYISRKKLKLLQNVLLKYIILYVFNLIIVTLRINQIMIDIKK